MTRSKKTRRPAASPQVRITVKRSRIDEKIQKRVSEEVDRILPANPFPTAWNGSFFDRFRWMGGTCPVCKCPDYGLRQTPVAAPRDPFRGGLLGVVTTPLFDRRVCAHCSADADFLTDPALTAELFDLRESVVVEGLSYEEFCKQELGLLERYMTPEDIKFSNQMVELTDAASFTVNRNGQPCSLRTGLLIRRFQILQALRKAAWARSCFEVAFSADKPDDWD